MTINYLDSKRLQGLSADTKPTIAIPLTGCKAYYNFEQTSGNLINQATTANGFTDGLGSSADGTNNGATQTATGKIGNAWYTTSTSNYVSIPNTLINGQNKISISTWFYPTVNGVSDIIFSGIFNYPSLVDWNFRFTQGHSTATIYIPTGTGNPGLNYHEYSELGLSLNTWHHLAVVYDGTQSQNVDRLKYYVNGVLKTPAATNYPIPTSTYTTSYGARLFNLDSNSHAVYSVHNHRLDEFSLWNRVLTSNEITNLYNSGSGKLLDTQTNVQTNSIFEQTDTNTRHWYDGTNWITQPTFEDDFSSYADQASADAVWATTDTTEMRVNPTTDVLDVQFSDDATNNSISYDIGSAKISGTAWVLRFKLRFSSLTVADQSYFLIGLCDQNHTITNSSTSDFIGLFGENSSGSKYFSCKSNDGTTMLTPSYDPKSLTWATSTNYYFEIIRESATSMRINYYSDDAYSVLVNTSTTTTNMSTGLTGLRYFKCLNDSRAAMNGDWTGTIDDIKFYNGVTSV